MSVHSRSTHFTRPKQPTYAGRMSDRLIGSIAFASSVHSQPKPSSQPWQQQISRRQRHPPHKIRVIVLHTVAFSTSSPSLTLASPSFPSRYPIPCLSTAISSKSETQHIAAMITPSSPTAEHDMPSPHQSHADDLPHRHATLKKKCSIKRPTSKRSKAETPESRAVSPTSPRSDADPHGVIRSPLYCPVPFDADPTVVLAMRFQGSTVCPRSGTNR